VRILYGVFGYGRGHATRAAAVLPELRQRHDVTVLAGGDAYDQLAAHFPVVRIPTLRYEYGADGRRSLSRTFGENLRHVVSLAAHGESLREVERLATDFRPHVAICDAEPWTHAAAGRLGIPRISFDHFGILAYCRPEIAWYDRLRSVRDVYAYRSLMGQPDRIIVSSFYEGGARDPRIRFVGPLLREEVLASRPSRGDHLLAYFNQGDLQLLPPIERALHRLRIPVVVYGTTRQGSSGLLTFRPPSNLPFLEDLASCRAVFSTAGNQLVGEAMYLGKPMLVMPEHTVEQRLNGAAVERLGIGLMVQPEDVSPEAFQRFFAREEAFAAAARRQTRDGRADALVALEGFARELARRAPRGVARTWRYA
jgi:uncharacterized protein (TIGR00661 family)